MIPYLRHAIPNEPLAARRAQHVHFRVTDEIAESELRNRLRERVEERPTFARALRPLPPASGGAHHVRRAVAVEVAGGDFAHDRPFELLPLPERRAAERNGPRGEAIDTHRVV